MHFRSRRDFRKRYQSLILGVRFVLFFGVPLVYLGIGQLTGGIQKGLETGTNRLSVSGSNKRTDEAEGTCTVKKRKRSSGTVHEAPKIERSPVKTVVMETFSGSSTTNVECSNCNKVSAKKDTFRDLQLCFPLTNKQRNDEVYSVQQLLDFYCSDEMMSGENKYACGNCNSLQDARKSMIIDRAPQNLIIVLKHFWFDGKHQYRAKLLHRVEHNRTISLLEGDTMVKFDLYAAVVHSGNSLDSGHYYTIARDGQHWYKFDDTRVTVCRESELHSLPSPNTPYVLFYKREGFSTPCASPARPIETVSEADAYGEAEEPSAASSDSEEFLPFSSLPVDLREKITRDNLQYRSQYTRTRTSRSMMKNPRTPRDSDDDSPSPCGGSNDIKTNFNRYIY